MLSNEFLEERPTDDRWKSWRFLVDCPEVPADRLVGASPPHAVAGDVLWEDLRGDDLTPYQLRRDGRRIGDPEPWNVSHLFVGLRQAEPESRFTWPTLRKIRLKGGGEGWVLRNPVSSCPLFKDIQDGALITWSVQAEPYRTHWAVYGLAAQGADHTWEGIVRRLQDYTFHEIRGMAEIGADPEARAAAERLLVDAPHEVPPSVLVRKDVPAAGLRAGDLLFVAAEADLPLPDGARTEGLALEAMRAAREAALEAGGALTDLTPWDGIGKGRAWRKLTDRRRWGLRAKEWTPKLQVVRFPLRRRPEQVTAPLRAKTDVAAIFELLAQVGGRMPQEAHDAS